jgi:hypothetical protein
MRRLLHDSFSQPAPRRASGVRVRSSLLSGIRMRGVELIDVDISGELQNVMVNGVDIAPLVEAELNRRMPERAKMRPKDPAGLHRSVDGEWSFIQTLRHLNFANAAWIDRMILGRLSPWHPLDLPWDEAPGWEGIPWDRDAQPRLDEVLQERREHQATMREVLAALTGEQPAGEVTRTEPGRPRREAFPSKSACLIVVNEEWEHRLYAERDLAAIAAPDPKGKA